MQLIGLGTILSMFLLPMHSFAECLKEGQDVAFTGIVSREIFPGPPNYEGINDGEHLKHIGY